jgi:hypothetical protein
MKLRLKAVIDQTEKTACTPRQRPGAVLAYLQMRSQFFIAVGTVFAVACGEKGTDPVMSVTSTHDAAPDLSLERVAFARISEGRVVARGTAHRLDYRRAGGRVTAADGSALMEPTKGYTSYGTLHFTAPAADGEISGRSGVATGGVHLDTAHGDAAATERVEYEGAAGFVRSATPVDARGPGYRVHGNGLLARADGSAIQLVRGVRGLLEMEARR